MKKFIALSALLTLALIYVVSAAVGLAALGSAARSGDVDAILARVDLPSVRRSVALQIVSAYLAQTGSSNAPSKRAELLARTIGPAVADAMLAKVITPENVAVLLQSGRISGTADHPEIAVPGLPSISAENLIAGLRRIRPVQFNEFAVKLGERDQRAYGIRMRLDGSSWKMSAVDLPATLAAEIASRLPRG